MKTNPMIGCVVYRDYDGPCLLQITEDLGNGYFLAAIYLPATLEIQPDNASVILALAELSHNDAWIFPDWKSYRSFDNYDGNATAKVLRIVPKGTEAEQPKAQ